MERTEVATTKERIAYAFAIAGLVQLASILVFAMCWLGPMGLKNAAWIGFGLAAAGCIVMVRMVTLERPWPPLRAAIGVFMLLAAVAIGFAVILLTGWPLAGLLTALFLAVGGLLMSKPLR